MRIGRYRGWMAAGALLLVAGGFWLNGATRQTLSANESLLGPHDSVAAMLIGSEDVLPAESSPTAVHQAAIGRGGSLYQSLVSAGLSPQAVQPIFDAFDGVLELRHLRSTDEVVVELGAGGDARRVEIVRGPAERYEATVDSAGTRAYRLELPVETRLARYTGSVESSLYDAIIAAGGDPELVAHVADLLAWDVDFFTDPRQGDSFDILVEQRFLDGERVGQGPILMASYVGARASQTTCRFVNAAGEPGYFNEDGKSLRKALLKSPLNYRRISSTFSHRRLHPITKVYRPHLGVDFAAPVGTPVVAVGDGSVRFAGRKGGNGNLVILRHPNGYETFYLHLSRFGRGVRSGARVSQGQVIGYVGSTGMSTGPHLDFRVKHRGRFLNPLRLTLPPGPPVPKAELAAYRETWDQLTQVRAALEPGGVVALGEDDVSRIGGHLVQVLAASAGTESRFVTP